MLLAALDQVLEKVEMTDESTITMKVIAQGDNDANAVSKINR